MRVAFLTPWDVQSPRSWSGVVAPMFTALADRVDVVPVQTAGVRDALVDRAACRLLDGRWGRYLPGHALATAAKRGAYAGARIREVEPDVVLAVAASQDVAFLTAAVPVVQVSDTTLDAIVDYYPLYAHLNPLLLAQARIQARRSSERAAHTLAASEWARLRLIRDDKIPSAKITVAPFGPALTASPVDRPHRREFRALLVASDWVRKGGPSVVEAVGRARDRGVPVMLRVVGADGVPGLPEWVETTGRLDAAGMVAEYAAADVLIELPTSSAAGVVLTDAAAAGLPVVACQTGGVGSIVDDHTTGFLVSPIDAVAQAVLALERLADPVLREQMGRAARERYESFLTWDRWADAAVDVFDRVIR